MNFDILLKKIKEYDSIAIFGHVRPDGDCYGSLNGLKNIILTTYPKKKVYCLTAHVDSLSFLGKMDDVNDEVFVDSLAIVCDTATRERICDQRYKLCKEIIKVDHHLIIDNYGSYNFVDEDIAATSLLMTKLKAYVFRTLKVSKNGVVYAKLSKFVIKYYNLSYEEASSLVNLLANIKECPVWILFIEYPKEIRVRIRSNGPEINMLAEAYGGGGHQKAAGASVKSWFASSQLIKDADELVKAYKNNLPYEFKRSK